MNYKSIYSGKIISGECYSKIPYTQKKDYIPESLSATHRVKSDGNYHSLEAIVETAILSELLDSQTIQKVTL